MKDIFLLDITLPVDGVQTLSNFAFRLDQGDSEGDGIRQSFAFEEYLKERIFSKNPQIHVVPVGTIVSSRKDTSELTVDGKLRFTYFPFSYGQDHIPLQVITTGIPTIRTFWVQPDVLTPEGKTNVTPAQQLVVTGKTLGPTAPPEPFEPLRFIEIIRGYLVESQKLGWLVDQAWIEKFTRYVDVAASTLKEGDIATAKYVLREMLFALPEPPTPRSYPSPRDRPCNVNDCPDLFSWSLEFRHCAWECVFLLRHNVKFLRDHLPVAPDIVLTTLISQKDPVLRGTPLHVDAIIRNQGGGIAPASTLKIRLLGQQTIPLSNFYSLIKPIDLRAQETLTLTAEIPTDTPPGQYSLEGCIEIPHNGVEISTTNNCKTVGPITVVKSFMHALQITRDGRGTVTSQPVGINCGKDCHEEYKIGTHVTLTATPAIDSIFTGWRGACTGMEVCTLTVHPTTQITATFMSTKRVSMIRRISVSSDGSEGNENSYAPSISADGRFVAFASEASNLVPGDTNKSSDIFVRDVKRGTTHRVSVASDGSEGNGHSDFPAISADGRYVTFRSLSSNLVPADTNDGGDIFIHDLQYKTTYRVSVASNGREGDDESFQPVISADGRFVAFVSTASNLVPHDTNGISDIFIRDIKEQTTNRVSITSDGREGQGNSYSPAISSNGRFIAFRSWDTHLADGDTKGITNIFVRDMKIRKTTRVSVSSYGNEENTDSYEAMILADGRFIALTSPSSYPVSSDGNRSSDILIRDAYLEMTTRIQVTPDENRDGYNPAISADGRFIAFTSQTGPMYDDYTLASDMYVCDRTLEKNSCIVVTFEDQKRDWGVRDLSISPDGRFMVVTSMNENLVPADSNRAEDIFIVNNPLARRSLLTKIKQWLGKR